MDLESLANELLLDVFEYLSSVHLLQAFYDMNTRFNDLIFLHFQRHALNFQSTSKYDFELVCEKYLPSINERIDSLRLSDDDDTPQQINLFFSYNFSLEQFSYLQSLSIYRIYSFHSLQRIIDQLPSLLYLHHLTITRYSIIYNEIYDIGIIDCLERLQHLIYCHLDITSANDQGILTPSIHSSSLKDLSIPHWSCTVNQLLDLIQHISNLQSLDIRIVDHSITSPKPSRQCLTVKKLNILFYGSFHAMNNLLQTMPNLQELKLNMPSTYFDGYHWETIIESSLPHLIIFQFKMSTSLSNQKNKEEKINGILKSFRSPFWIEKHRWFIQCHWVHTDLTPVVYVYTLPYAFYNFLHTGHGQLISTCPDDHQEWSFDRIHNLYFNHIPSENSSSSSIHLNRIQYLDLTVPYDNSFWSLVSTLDRLKSLTIVLNSEMDSNDIQLKLEILINRSLHLRSLTFFSWSIQNIFPFELKTSSIRQLDLRAPSLFYNYIQCIELSRSSIGQRCQVLLINVEQRSNIIYLVNHMHHLHALIVKCPKELETAKENEDLIEWLGQNLPATCAISNTTETDDNIRLWIR